MTVEVETGTEGDEVLEEVVKVEVTAAVDVETGTEGVLVLVLLMLEDTETIDAAVLVVACEVKLSKSLRGEQRPQAVFSLAQLPRMGWH